MSFNPTYYDTYFTNIRDVNLYIPSTPTYFSYPLAFRTVHWGENSIRYFTPDPIEVLPAFGCYTQGFAPIESGSILVEPISHLPVLPAVDITKNRLYRRRMRKLNHNM